MNGPKPMSTDQSPPDPTRPPTNPTSRPTVPIGAAALFLLACVPYWYMMIRISEFRCCDPDRGLSQYFIGRDEFGDIDLAFFAFTVILLWILLGCLLIPAVMRRSSSGQAARWEPLGAVIVFP